MGSCVGLWASGISGQCLVIYPRNKSHCYLSRELCFRSLCHLKHSCVFHSDIRNVWSDVGGLVHAQELPDSCSDRDRRRCSVWISLHGDQDSNSMSRRFLQQICQKGRGTVQ